MDYSYVITPCIAWVVAGGLKFLISSTKAGRWDFNLLGYGGLPSNHSAIVTSTAAIIALNDGVRHPAFSVALTLALIVIMDANSLRQQMGRHAQLINRLTQDKNGLRERMGHSKIEILAGIVTGIAVALLVKFIL